MRYLLIIALCLGFTNYYELAAQGDLSVIPRRVIFDNGNKRSETLYLTNRGNDSATYNLSYVNYALDDLGKLTKVSEDSAVNPSSKNFRIFPRRVTLAPNETQTVKLQLRQFANLEDGEYRSHLLFRALPKEAERTSSDDSQDAEGVGIELRPVYGITIPNIIRKGKNETKASISDAILTKVDEDTYDLKFDINRNGNMSIYGVLTIDYLQGDGTVKNLGTIPGIALYAGNNRRMVEAQIKDDTIDFTSGKIKITFTSKEEWNINDILAEDVIEL